MLILFKFTMTVFVILGFAYLRALGKSGIALKRKRLGLETERYEMLMSNHQRMVSRVLKINLWAVIAVLAFQLILPAHQYTGWLASVYFIHRYAFAIPFFAFLLIIKKWFRGDQRPEFHRWLTYCCLALGFGMTSLAEILAIAR